MPRQKEYPCLSCDKNVGEEDSLCCDFCDQWVHLECTALSRTKFEEHLQNFEKPFKCIKCQQANSSLSSSPLSLSPTTSGTDNIASPNP